MKNSPSAPLSLLVLVLVTLIFFAGCASLNGNPAPSLTPTTAAHGTFVFVSGANSVTDPLFGYRLNPDGTLTAIPGSPFPISGQVAASGGFLMAARENVLASYRVDPATGVPTQAASIPAVSFLAAVGADARNVYVIGTTSARDTVIQGFSVASSAALTPLSASPYMYQPACPPDIDCPVLLFPNLALNNKFLALSVVGFRGAGGISVYARDSNGVLGGGGGAGLEQQSAVALQPPSGNVAFSNDFGAGTVNSYLLDSNGKPTQQMSLSTSFGAMDEGIDPSGKFLLVLDNTGAVHVFTIDSTTAGFNQIGTSEPAGPGANMLAMDPTGHFVIVAQSSNQAIPAPPDQITVFTFDPASAVMKKLQSYPVGKLPFRIAIVAE